VAGNTASRAVFICYVICAILGFGLFFGASNRKEAEMDFVRKWRDEFARKQTMVGGGDVEAGGNEGDAVQRREWVGVDTIQGTALAV
jgi:hypothetical protein